MPAVTGAGPGPPPAGRPLGVGVLGCAEIALRRFLPALVASKRARLAAIGSRDRGQAAAVAARLGCEAADYQGLLASEEVDLVYLPLANHLHEAWVVAALDRGKHVLCEKPLGLSPGSVDRMLAAAERNGRLLHENLQYLHHPQHGRITELLRAGHLGAVTGLDCTFHIPWPAPGGFRLDPSRGGGAFHDLSRYPLSAAGLHLEGAIDEVVRCQARWQEGLDVSMEAEATTTAGERLSFSIAFGRPYRSCYEVRGTDGSLRLERAFTPPPEHECLAELRRGDAVEALRLPAADQFRLAIDHVAGRIGEGAPFRREHERARGLARIAERFLAAAGREHA